jgi:hypothetical protein
MFHGTGAYLVWFAAQFIEGIFWMDVRRAANSIR